MLVQDPSMSQMLESETNPSQKDQIEERMAKIRGDPALKSILEERETGGPAAMMSYWNDKDVLQKLGEAMGLAVSGELASSVGNSGQDEAEEGAMRMNRLSILVPVLVMLRQIQLPFLFPSVGFDFITGSESCPSIWC